MARNLPASVTARSFATPHVILAVFVTAAMGVLIVASGAWAFRENRGLLDWGSFWASGDAANHGLDPFGVYPDTFSIAGEPAPNLNPPISVYPFQFAAKFDPFASRDAFVVMSLLVYAGCVAALWRAYPERDAVTAFAAFTFGGLWHTLELGQIYVPLVVAMTAGWLLLRRGQAWQAGVALGCVAAIKPQFAIILALLLLAGHWRVAVSGFGAAAVLSAIPLILEGPGIYRGWFDATPPATEANTLAGNSSLIAVTGRADAPWLGIALTAAMLAAAALVTWRRKPAALPVVAIGLIAALLTGPITWPGYTLLLLPLLFAVPWQQVLPALAFLFVPYWVVIDAADESQALSLLVGSIYAWGILAFAALLARSQHSALRTQR